MSKSISQDAHPHRSRVTAGLMLALGLSSTGALAKMQSEPPRAQVAAENPFAAAATQSKRTSTKSASAPQSVATVRHVITCDDSGSAGSLRGEILAAADGDSIDFDMAQMHCSRITLGSEILVMQNTLHIYGPGADQLTIDGNWNSRIFDHIGTNEIDVDDLSLVNGYARIANVSGGCVFSLGFVGLTRSTVSNCIAYDNASSNTFRSQVAGSSR
jgi:hypothetical protein